MSMFKKKKTGVGLNTLISWCIAIMTVSCIMMVLVMVDQLSPFKDCNVVKSENSTDYFYNDSYIIQVDGNGNSVNMTCGEIRNITSMESASLGRWHQWP